MKAHRLNAFEYYVYVLSVHGGYILSTINTDHCYTWLIKLELIANQLLKWNTSVSGNPAVVWFMQFLKSNYTSMWCIILCSADIFAVRPLHGSHTCLVLQCIKCHIYILFTHIHTIIYKHNYAKLYNEKIAFCWSVPQTTMWGLSPLS